jgi:hypothetical protein
LLTGIPDAGDRLHLHRALYFEARIRRQRGDAVILLLQTLDPLLTRPRRDRARRLSGFFQLRQNFIRVKFLMMCLFAQPKRSVADGAEPSACDRHSG